VPALDPVEGSSQLPSGEWAGCRHWCGDHAVGPDRHRHLGDPLRESDPYVPTPSKGPPPKEKETT
jgi:hypothetical protein